MHRTLATNLFWESAQISQHLQHLERWCMQHNHQWSKLEEDWYLKIDGQKLCIESICPSDPIHEHADSHECWDQIHPEIQADLHDIETIFDKIDLVEIDHDLSTLLQAMISLINKYYTFMRLIFWDLKKSLHLQNLQWQ